MNAIRSKADVGFNRRVKGAWLHEALQLAAAGVPEDEIAAALKARIAEDNAGSETIRKVFVHLRRVWIDPPEYCRALRDDALEMFRERPDRASSFLLSWGMCIAAYPFIGCVAEATGRLLRLQGEAGARQVNLRVREEYGDRAFVQRSVRYNLSTFLDLGAVKLAKEPGSYLPGALHSPRTDRELAWLVEALLHSRREPSLPLQAISSHPSLFPFDLGSFTARQLRANPRLHVLRHGLDESLVGVDAS